MSSDKWLIRLKIKKMYLQAKLCKNICFIKEIRASKQQQKKRCKKARPQFLSQMFLLNSIVTGLGWRLLFCPDFAMTVGNLEYGAAAHFSRLNLWALLAGADFCILYFCALKELSWCWPWGSRVDRQARRRHGPYVESRKHCTDTAVLLSAQWIFCKIPSGTDWNISSLAWEITGSWEIHALNPREWPETRLFSVHHYLSLFLTKMIVQAVV